MQVIIISAVARASIHLYFPETFKQCHINEKLSVDVVEKLVQISPDSDFQLYDNLAELRQRLNSAS